MSTVRHGIASGKVAKEDRPPGQQVRAKDQYLNNGSPIVMAGVARYVYCYVYSVCEEAERCATIAAVLCCAVLCCAVLCCAVLCYDNVYLASDPRQPAAKL